MASDSSAPKATEEKLCFSEDNGAPPRPKAGSPCWVEICTADSPAKLKEFYSALFPAWEWKSTPEQEEKVAMYSFSEPKGLSGGIVRLPEGHKSEEQPLGIGQTVYFYVESLEETEKKVHELGGKTVLQKMPESDNGWFMNFKDPVGNRFGAYEFNWARHSKTDGA
ncbi:hypothetical protein M011DRAFT_461794 [Sporormia fimetaria CBS 119925]|uniref:Uncharacterized protein n=1 Tax=Sporormia fimetaria CBS 119925 TaxID=1340428 RepID=A0A6A6V149_9PLEO|nr:hypothetical protein M011DRAFT_461794 [Sporormia fimetaria CBS 119925]